MLGEYLMVKYSKYVNEIPYAIVFENIITKVNGKFIELIEYTEEEVNGKSLSDLCELLRINSPSKLENIGENWNYYLFTSSHEPREVSIMRQDLASAFWRIYYFIEKENSRLEFRFPYLEKFYYDNVEGVAIHSVPDLILLKANETYLNYIEVPFNKKEYAIGRRKKDFTSFYRGHETELLWKEVLAHSRPGYLNEYKYNSQSMGIMYFDISMKPVCIDGRVKYVIETVHDVTERVLSKQKFEEHEKNMKKQRDELYNTFNMLNLPIIRLSYYDYSILELNKDAYNFLSKICQDDIPKFELIKRKSILNFIKDFNTGKNYNYIKNMEKTKGTTYYKNAFLNLDGQEIYANLIYQPILDFGGEIVEFLIVLVDITDVVKEKKHTESLMKAQEELFSFIAHEFKTPLTTISATIQLLELTYKSEMTDKIKNSINMIKRNTYQQLRLVNNLLDMTRADAGYLKINMRNYDIVSITKAITNSIDSFAKAKDIKVNFDSDIMEKVISIDEEKYERILLNLLSNAIKFTPISKQIYVTILEKHDKVHISVKDEGVGIPRDKQKIIFDRFGQVGNNYTRQSEGTGIGLCLVKLLLQSMEGDILLESEEGKGSLFTIILSNKLASELLDEPMPEITNSRLINSLNIEFSNIYL